jgi:hypothetical protein
MGISIVLITQQRIVTDGSRLRLSDVQGPPTLLIQSETRCTTTPSIPNDALLIYFTDATLASAFVARSCIGAKVKTDGGARMSRSRESGRDCTGRRAGSRAKIR